MGGTSAIRLLLSFACCCCCWLAVCYAQTTQLITYGNRWQVGRACWANTAFHKAQHGLTDLKHHILKCANMPNVQLAPDACS